MDGGKGGGGSTYHGVPSISCDCTAEKLANTPSTTLDATRKMKSQKLSWHAGHRYLRRTMRRSVSVVLVKAVLAIAALPPWALPASFGSESLWLRLSSSVSLCPSFLYFACFPSLPLPSLSISQFANTAGVVRAEAGRSRV